MTDRFGRGGRADGANTGGGDIHRQIAELVVALHPGAHPMEPVEVLASVTRSAKTMLEPVDHAAVTLAQRASRGKPPHLETTATTDPVADRFDALQLQHGGGPCIEAIWTDDVVRVDDMARETRWPGLTAAVVSQTAIRSSLSIQLFVSDLTLGALNLYSEKAAAFDADVIDQAMVLATHASIAFDNARRDEQFRAALASRDIIGQAKGMLMERFTIDADHAFRLLPRLSQDTNTRLADIARRLVETDHPSTSTVDPADDGPTPL